ncbi:MAG TPA: ribose-phosphate diphosphokinase [Acidimicrobiia bacterium]|nr:ribose-phosphate diphosphokinase [Acidimicrobiia bacterium]
MELPGKKRLLLFSGSANPALAEEVARLLGTHLGGVERSRFANGEIYIRFDESVRGADCFVLQSHSEPVNFHIMEQLIMLDALHRASAKRITAVVPFYGYARQDKKHLAREPITARLMADLFVAAGADRIVSMDLHSAQIQGFTVKPFDHLTALPVFYQYLHEVVGDSMVIVSPDTGRVRLASRFARHLDAGVAFIHKRRRAEVHNESAALQVVGEVAGLHAVIIDDMIDTGSTVVAAAELLREAGALSVRALATHGVLSPPAAERFATEALDEVVITNTLPVPEEVAGLAKLKVLSVGPILADALRAIFSEESVSALFMGENA